MLGFIPVYSFKSVVDNLLQKIVGFAGIERAGRSKIRGGGCGQRDLRVRGSSYKRDYVQAHADTPLTHCTPTRSRPRVLSPSPLEQLYGSPSSLTSLERHPTLATTGRRAGVGRRTQRHKGLCAPQHPLKAAAGRGSTYKYVFILSVHLYAPTRDAKGVRVVETSCAVSFRVVNSDKVTRGPREQKPKTKKLNKKFVLCGCFIHLHPPCSRPHRT